MENRPKNLRERYSMSRKEFCRYFRLPYKTVQKWETGERTLNSHEYDLFRKTLEWRRQMYKLLLTEDLRSEEFPGHTGNWYIEDGRLGVETEHNGKKRKKLLDVEVTPGRMQYMDVYGVWTMDEILAEAYWESHR